jgi:hypothetical protein
LKIGIIEICESNHYTAVEALALTYATSLENHITIFTLKEMAHHFQFQDSNISIITPKNNGDLIDFLNSINTADLDRIHINTISKYYKEFSTINWKVELILTIHNIDIWLDNALHKRWSLLKHKLFNYKVENYKLKLNLYLPIKYFIKEIKLQTYRDKIIKDLLIKKNKVLVYSEAQSNYLVNFFKKEDILVFPFCVHQPIKDTSINNSKIRICIPGSVDNHRRDYSGLFKLLENHINTFKNHLSIDLLGYIPKLERHLIPAILKLQKLGLEIIFNTDFIDQNEYQHRLSLCDIILGNLRVSLNNQSKYGETKETGVIFNMIKAAKPGIFPSSYPIPKNLKKVCLVYEDNLGEVINHLVTNNSKLKELKQKAKIAAKEYEPKKLYSILIH